MIMINKGDIAIVGGSGFIGTVLVRRFLEDGFKVRILDIAQPPKSSAAADYRYSDVRDLPLLTGTLKGCGVIVNLAAAHHDDVRPLSLYHDTNVLGAENVRRAAEALGINDLVFTSSVAIYGLPLGIPEEETTPNPFNLYGETKWQAEDVYRAWQQSDPVNRRLEIVRPTVVFGPNNRGNVYKLLKQLTHSRFVMIGEGKNRKSMAFVENVAAFLKFLLHADHKPGAYTYNYCDTPAFSMNELLHIVRRTLNMPAVPFVTLPYWAAVAIGTCFDAVARLSGLRFAVSKVRVQKFCADTVFASERARASGFVPPYDLAQALQTTIAYEFPDKIMSGTN